MAPTPRLRYISTAVPRYAIHQDDVMAWARRLFAGHGDIERLLPAFMNAGIETRYSCVPLDWYAEPHGWGEKNRLYVDNAVALLEQATRACLAGAGRDIGEVDAIVCVSTSGIATPSLDALLIERLGMRRDVRRLPIFGLGCAGGVLGLARAAAQARAAPVDTILFLVVELCGLTFRHADRCKSNIIATALFGDGAAAALIDCQGPGPALAGWGEHTWPQSLEVMGWRVEDDGFGVLFSRDIPNLVQRRFRPAAEEYLDGYGLTLEDMDGYICHPGGAKVITALEDALGLAEGALAETRGVLRDYGNMSAATVMFVLERALAQPVAGRQLMSALGPGFTAGFLTLEME